MAASVIGFVAIYNFDIVLLLTECGRASAVPSCCQPAPWSDRGFNHYSLLECQNIVKTGHDMALYLNEIGHICHHKFTTRKFCFIQKPNYMYV